LLERSAAAVEQILEKRFQTERAGDAVFNFGDLFRGEFFPARADRSILPKAAEEELDFGERKTHLGGKANQQDAVESVRGVTTLAADTVGRGKQTEPFIVADRRSAETGAVSKLADFHGTSPSAATVAGSFSRSFSAEGF
jgi:hypothetical protein